MNPDKYFIFNLSSLLFPAKFDCVNTQETKELLYYAIYLWLAFRCEAEHIDYLLSLKLTLNDLVYLFYI